MSEHARPPIAAQTPASPLALGLLALLALIFAWSRTAGLDLGLYHDEVYTVTRYVHGGPEAIFFGSYVPNNHPLFSLVAWLTWTFAGDSELVFRFWSVIPAVVVAITFVAWVWRRWSPTAAIALAALVTTSPLIASLSVLARGYGLAMLAVGLSVITGVEAARNPRPRFVALSVGAVAAAALTLPVLALTAVGVVLGLWLAVPSQRRALIVAAATAGVVCLAAYAPILTDLLQQSSQEFGSVLPWYGFLSGPLETLLFPTLRPLQPGPSSVSMQHPVDPSMTRLVWFGITAALTSIGIYRLVRWHRRAAAVVLSPILITFIGLTASRFFVEPRFVSPLFLLMALLVALSVDQIRIWLPDQFRGSAAWLGSVIVFVLVLAVLPAFQEMTQRPIEAFASVGRLVETLDGPVITNSKRPTGLQYYIERKVEVRATDELEGRLCDPQQAFVFIEHPLLAEPVDTSCLRDRGAQRTRFLQRDRGNYIDVWQVPTS